MLKNLNILNIQQTSIAKNQEELIISMKQLLRFYNYLINTEDEIVRKNGVPILMDLAAVFRNGKFDIAQNTTSNSSTIRNMNSPLLGYYINLAK